jgi:hypothetical protein
MTLLVQRHIEDELSEYIIRQKEDVPSQIDFTVRDGVIVLVPHVDADAALTN